jgi:hypothetical protein
MKQASVSSTDQGGKWRAGTGGSGYFQTAHAQLIDRLGTRGSFTLGVIKDLSPSALAPGVACRADVYSALRLDLYHCNCY